LDLIAGNDLLILKNGDRITGEIKKLNNGNVEIDADYGENIFIIDWSEVERIESKENFVAQTSNGDRLSGSVRTDPQLSTQILVEGEDETVPVEQSRLVYLKPVDESFWGRFGASLDVGFTFTKADETKQFNTRASASYLTEVWSAEAKVNVLRNVRETTDTTRRTEASGLYRRALTNLNERWFGVGFANLLQSNELQLDLRSTLGTGLGRFVVRNNRWRFAVTGGAAWTNENFQDPDLTDRSTGEAFGAVELNLFDIGDLDILTTYSIFPSFTDFGRVRMDFDTDFRWEIINDFYISLGFTENYNSSPMGTTPGSDYIFSTSIGWSH